MEWDIFGFCKMQCNIELNCTNSFNITVLILLSDTFFVDHLLFITCFMFLTNTWYLMLSIWYSFYDDCSQMLATTCYYLQKLDSFRSCSATRSCYFGDHLHFWVGQHFCGRFHLWGDPHIYIVIGCWLSGVWRSVFVCSKFLNH